MRQPATLSVIDVNDSITLTASHSTIDVSWPLDSNNCPSITGSFKREVTYNKTTSRKSFSYSQKKYAKYLTLIILEIVMLFLLLFMTDLALIMMIFSLTVNCNGVKCEIPDLKPYHNYSLEFKTKYENTLVKNISKHQKTLPDSKYVTEFFTSMFTSMLLGINNHNYILCPFPDEQFLRSLSSFLSPILSLLFKY